MENENCFKLNASLSGRSSLDSTLVKSRQLTGQAANYQGFGKWLLSWKSKQLFPSVSKHFNFNRYFMLALVWNLLQNSRSEVDIWQQFDTKSKKKNEALIDGWQKEANYANCSWSTATWQPATCSCPGTRSVKSPILASRETSTLTRHTGKKPRENVSKIWGFTSTYVMDNDTLYLIINIGKKERSQLITGFRFEKIDIIQTTFLF